LGDIGRNFAEACSKAQAVWKPHSAHQEQPQLRPACKFTPLMRIPYEGRNWCYRRPVRTWAYPFCITEHHCTVYGNSRLLLCPQQPLQILSQNRDKLRSFIKACLELIIQPQLHCALEPARSVVGKSETAVLNIRWDNYGNANRQVRYRVRAVPENVKGKAMTIAAGVADVPARSTVKQQVSFEAAKRIDGIYRLQLLSNDQVLSSHMLAVLPTERQELSGRNFWTRPDAPRFVLNFRGYGMGEGSGSVPPLVGFDGVAMVVPWNMKGKTVEDAVDWDRFAAQLADAGEHGTKVVVGFYAGSYPPIFSNLSNPIWPNYNRPGVTVLENHQVWTRFLKILVEFCRDKPAVVGYYLLPHTGSSAFRWDCSPAANEDFRRFLRQRYKDDLAAVSAAHGKAYKAWSDIRIPDKPADAKTPHPCDSLDDINGCWADYIAFWRWCHDRMIRESIKAIRSVDPDAPIVVRGSRYDLSGGLTFNTLKDFTGVAFNCECVETSEETHVYLYGQTARTGVPTLAENGWPGCHGEPTRSSIYKALMGDYKGFFYSSGHSTQLLPDLEQWARYAYASAVIGSSNTRYDPAALALLVSDSTELYAGPRARNKYRRITKTLLRTNCAALATNAQEPMLSDMGSVKVLLDDGANAVITASSRKEILAWINNGGTLICAPPFGMANERGRCESLARWLETRAQRDTTAGKLPAASAAYKLGKGRVVVADFDKLADNLDALRRLLSEVGVEPAVSIDPNLPAVIRRNDKHAYLMLYDVDPKVIGAYFPYPERCLETGGTMDVTIKMPPGFDAAEDVYTGRKLPVTNRHISFRMPKLTGKILRLTRTQD